jgi:hypothetical protein
MRVRARSSGLPERGSCGRYPISPERSMRPPVGWPSPARIFVSGAVAADEADLVSRAHPERDVLHEDAGADAQLQVVYSEHGEGSF